MRALLIVALMGMASPAVAADQFDLICNGTMRTSSKGNGEPHSSRYRIDLTKNEWCEGDCTTVRNVASFNSGMIFLQDKKKERPGDFWVSNKINRQTGAWSFFFSDPYMLTEGSCEPAPFSGIGSQPKKF